MKLYVTQYGFWWSVSVDRFLEFAALRATGDLAYNIDNELGFKPLAARPAKIHVDEEGHYWSEGPLYFRILDADIRDWQEFVAITESFRNMRRTK